jgi:hypothetical protein
MFALMKDLLLVIQAIAGYPLPQGLPAYHVLADADLQQRACGRPCFVKAFYDPEQGIFLSTSTDFMGDSYGRSILLHELVHYAQNVSGRFEEISRSPCERRASEEMAAYEAQNQYLAMEGDPHRIPLGMLSFNCQ